MTWVNFHTLLVRSRIAYLLKKTVGQFLKNVDMYHLYNLPIPLLGIIQEEGKYMQYKGL